MPTFNDWTIIAMPAAPAPRSIEFTAQDVVAVSISPFTGQQQIQDWQAGWLEASVTMPPMPEETARAWTAFLLSLRGMANAFEFGVPPGACSSAPAVGTPVVNGTNQTGYTLNARGFTAGLANVMRAGDWLQIGSHLYQNLQAANADASGHAALNIWPALRESPADAAAINITNPKGLWRLKSNSRQWSITEIRIYGFQFEIREAF
jgi:hypothetical protein